MTRLPYLSFLPSILLALQGTACVAPQAPPPAAPGTPPVVSDARLRGQTEGPLRVETSEGPLEITFLETGFVRLRFTRSHSVKRIDSFAVDPDFTPHMPPVRLESSEGVVFLTSPVMSLEIQSFPLRIIQRDPQGNPVLVQSAQGLWANAGPSLSFSLDEGERVYGLGDKAKGHNRRGHQFEMWNTDAFGWDVDQDPLYKSFPVFMFMDGASSHGLFIDSPTRAQVDVGKSRSDELRYTVAQGDEIDVYLFAGPGPKAVLNRYTELTGRTPLPPYWSLGFHMSRYGYLSEKEVRAVVSRFREGNLPLDTIWLDIDFQKENAPFTVNREAFPHFREMISDFRARGVHTVAITDLHIKSHQGKPSPSGYRAYDEGAAGDHFLRNDSSLTADPAQSARFYEGKVWPGAAVFPEFTRTKTRDYWGQLYREFLDDGIAGFWNDMNEPAIFEVRDKTMKEEQLHRLDDGSTLPHQVVHNAYGALNVRATFEGVQKLRPNQRPFTLTRAAFAGAQRYSASWTGDNTANRAHLKATIASLTNLGVSGYPFIGADVGGFDGCPDAELLVEWMELGAFQPFYRNHSGKNTCMREPWLFGKELESRTRRAIERRYRFLPYLYTLFEEASRTGLPIMRPLWLEFPSDNQVANLATSFMLGSQLLVVPQLEAGKKKQKIQLPRAPLFDLSTGDFHEAGGAIDVEFPEDDSLRLFARAGSILPLSQPIQHAGDQNESPLVLRVFPGKRCSGELYIDDGESLDYRQGAFRRVRFSCSREGNQLTVKTESEGDFPTWWREIQLEIYGISDEKGDRSSAKLKVTTDTGTSESLVPLTHNEERASVQATFPHRGENFEFVMQ